MTLIRLQNQTEDTPKESYLSKVYDSLLLRNVSTTVGIQINITILRKRIDYSNFYLFQYLRPHKRLDQRQHFINKTHSVNDMNFFQLCRQTFLYVEEELSDRLYTDSG